MRFEEKLAAALGLLASTGMWRINYAPPLHRLLCKLSAKLDEEIIYAQGSLHFRLFQTFDSNG